MPRVRVGVGWGRAVWEIPVLTQLSSLFVPKLSQELASLTVREVADSRKLSTATVYGLVFVILV